MSEVDLNDESTWPETLDDIEALAATALGPDLHQGFVEHEPADEKAESETAEEPQEKPEAAEPELVLMADGKHAAPYSTLKEARAEAIQAKAEVERLREELELARQAPATEPDAPAAQAATASPLEDRIAKAREQYEEVKDEDPELAVVYELALASLESQARMQAEIDGFRSERQAQTQASEQAALDAAWAKADLLRAWADDKARPAWHAAATSLNQRLIAEGGDYARMTWDQRFAALPGLVEQQIGVPAPQRKPAAKAKEPEAMAPPPSMSALIGGDAALGSDDLAALERMTPQEMMAHLGRMADKGVLADLVYRVS